MCALRIAARGGAGQYNEKIYQSVSTFAVPVFHRGHLAVFFEHVLKVGLARKA